MKVPTRLGLAVALTTMVATPILAQNTPENSTTPATPPSAAAPTPSGVTPDLIAKGDKVFHGPGNCYACHGSNAEGLVGPNLTDAEWIHSKGTYDDIVAQVIHGVSKEESKSGIPMPPRGGGTISDDDVKAVAAYVYSLSHK
jgi:mono/diheme cytochrome c family protein